MDNKKSDIAKDLEEYEMDNNDDDEYDNEKDLEFVMNKNDEYNIEKIIEEFVKLLGHQNFIIERYSVEETSGKLLKKPNDAHDNLSLSKSLKKLYKAISRIIVKNNTGMLPSHNRTHHPF
jgi:hypothetical protein